MNLPPNPGRPQLTERLVVDLGAAFQQRAVYAAGHPQVQRAFRRALDAFEAWCRYEGTAEVSLLTLEGQLLVDRQAIPEDSPWARGVLQNFRRYEIGGLTLLAGLDAEELGRFFESCQSAEGAAATAHILVGRAGLTAGDTLTKSVTLGVPGRVAPRWLTAEQMAEARAELVAAAAGRASRVDRLRALVARLARSAETGTLEPLDLTPADSDDRAFLHGLAVALASLRLGRALGLAGEPLEELGFAAFVHDIGYLEPGAADESPAERRERHPIRGAARLAALEGIPDLAALVAYEHHLRFDRKPAYPPTSEPRAAFAAARVVAVADTWVTLRGRGEVPTGEALGLLRSRAGTFLDPALVDLFASLIDPQPA
ncbi:MAG: HD domain-containing protein [Thermoanaerobaculia bacterium]|nr:HD domain-containing protein [Thermoanaerobaculia bacterium]